MLPYGLPFDLPDVPKFTRVQLEHTGARTEFPTRTIRIARCTAWAKPSGVIISEVTGSSSFSKAIASLPRAHADFVTSRFPAKNSVWSMLLVWSNPLWHPMIVHICRIASGAWDSVSNRITRITPPRFERFSIVLFAIFFDRSAEP